MIVARPQFRMFEAQWTVRALVLPLLKAGNSKPARMAMMAITTSNSIKVKPACQRRRMRIAISRGEFDAIPFMPLLRVA